MLRRGDPALQRDELERGEQRDVRDPVRRLGQQRRRRLCRGYGRDDPALRRHELAPQISGSTEPLASVWGSGPADIFAVGGDLFSSTVTMLHYDGASWSAQPVPPGSSVLNGVWGSGPTNVFAVGYSGTILHYDGTSWSAQASGTTQQLFGVWGSAATDVFAVGDGSTILHTDGTSWRAQSIGTGTTEPFGGVWVSAATNVYVAGPLACCHGGFVFHGSR